MVYDDGDECLMGRIKTERIVLLLLWLCWTAAAAADNTGLQFKQGELSSDETWGGKIFLVSDVLVPEGITLTIENNTWLIYNDADFANIGDDPQRPEILVDGVLDVKTRSSIKSISASDPDVVALLPNNVRKVNIEPADVDLAPLQRRWRDWRRHYSYVWSIIYSIALVF